MKVHISVIAYCSACAGHRICTEKIGMVARYLNEASFSVISDVMQ